MARPRKPIDPTEVEKLASIGCKNEEIADWFGVGAQTIERRFRPELVKGRANIKISLRRWQLEAARKGNAAMLIWLGKQVLGQREKSDEEIQSEMSLAKVIYKVGWNDETDQGGHAPVPRANAPSTKD